MSANDTHTCVAEHCITCCPSARAYSEGVQLGKDLYRPTTAKVASTEALAAAAVGGVIFYLFRGLVKTYVDGRQPTQLSAKPDSSD